MVEKKQGKLRVNISIDGAVLFKIDEFADMNGISRSGAISVLVTQALMATEGVSTLKDMMALIQDQESKK